MTKQEIIKRAFRFSTILLCALTPSITALAQHGEEERGEHGSASPKTAEITRRRFLDNLRLYMGTSGGVGFSLLTSTSGDFIPMFDLGLGWCFFSSKSSITFCPIKADRTSYEPPTTIEVGDTFFCLETGISFSRILVPSLHTPKNKSAFTKNEFVSSKKYFATLPIILKIILPAPLLTAGCYRTLFGGIDFIFPIGGINIPANHTLFNSVKITENDLGLTQNEQRKCFLGLSVGMGIEHASGLYLENRIKLCSIGATFLISVGLDISRIIRKRKTPDVIRPIFYREIQPENEKEVSVLEKVPESPQ